MLEVAAPKAKLVAFAATSEMCAEAGRRVHDLRCQAPGFSGRVLIAACSSADLSSCACQCFSACCQSLPSIARGRLRSAEVEVGGYALITA